MEVLLPAPARSESSKWIKLPNKLGLRSVLQVPFLLSQYFWNLFHSISKISLTSLSSANLVYPLWSRTSWNPASSCKETVRCCWMPVGGRCQKCFYKSSFFSRSPYLEGMAGHYGFPPKCVVVLQRSYLVTIWWLFAGAGVRLWNTKSSSLPSLKVLLILFHFLSEALTQLHSLYLQGCTSVQFYSTRLSQV